MATLSDEKHEGAHVLETPKGSSSLSLSPPATPANIDAEKNASAGGTYLVTQLDGTSTGGLKVAKDGVTVLIPQPSDDLQDPLNVCTKRPEISHQTCG